MQQSPQQQPPSPSLPRGVTGQVSTNLNLKQLDSIAPDSINGQPLSPTQTSSNKQSSRIIRETGKQKGLKGPPQQVGLSTVEYAVEAVSVKVKDLQSSDLQKNCLKDLYDEQAIDFPFKVLSEQFAPPSNEIYQKIEVTINLPFDMAVEQVEIQVANGELFGKYLKMLKLETPASDKSMLHLRGGFYDSQKRILELNTCGVSNQLKLAFLYNLEQKPSKGPLKAPRGEQNVSDKIRNEILPLLQGPDGDSMDELDDEVAMISNMKSMDDAPISNDDIKIEIKPKPVTKKHGPVPNQAPSQEEECRNFNTMPRNYSESQAHKQQEEEGILQEIEHEIFEGEQKSESQQANFEVIKLIQKSIQSIKVIGFNCNQIPAITSLSTFMNNSFLLKKEGHLSEAYECDFIIGVLLISSKRTIQAVEVFRKIQANHLTQIETKVKDTNLQKNPAQLKLEVNKLYVRCALIELVTAESMCTAQQINEKLFCMKRMCELFQGKSVLPQVFQPQIHFMDDPYTTILRLLPVLLKFVLMCVTHKKEIVRISSMKLLEFILETKGCSLDNSMVFILKAILTTYPGMQYPQNNSQSVPSKPMEEQNQMMQHQESFCLSNLSHSVQEYFQYNHPQQKRLSQEIRMDSIPTEYKALKEPNSGFLTAMKNVYNHVLETYISVLSSISSHILHQLFYEVIIPTLNHSQQAINPPNIDVKIFAIKIAEKIITICQGDLVLNKSSLDQFLTAVSQKPQPNSTPEQQLYVTNLRNLWTSIRTKVFANYSQKGLKTIIDWLVDKMSQIAQSAGVNNKDMVLGSGNEEQIDESSNADISKLEITEEETNQLQQIFDIISVVSVSRRKNEEEANSHIKIKQDYILELYLLINPLLFWLDFSVEREERFSLFKSVYQTIKDVLENLPPKRVDIDLLQIMIPILQKTTDYLKNNSPSLSMLKFLEIVLRDIKAGGYCQMQSDLQYFFLEMLRNFVSYISYCLYDEVFSVFDKLLAMCADVINERVLTKCIVALVDKYTMKSKPHKGSLNQFMKVLMETKVRSRQQEKRPNNNHAEEDIDGLDDDQISVYSKNNYFEIMCNFCFIYNEDPSAQRGQQQQPQSIDNFRTPTDFHDLYIDKLQFFLESLQLMGEMHINIFTSMVMNPRFKSTLVGLLHKGELSLRLKCHEIMEVVTSYHAQYCLSKNTIPIPGAQPQRVGSAELQRRKPQQHEVMEVEFISLERMYLAQIVVQCVKASLECKQDSYLQFNSLISLDFLFQNLLPVPSFENELIKEQMNVSKDKKSTNNNQNQSINQYGGKPTGNSDAVLDIETMEINEHTPEFDVTQRQYMLMRLNLIFKLWPYIQQALNSAWSNIRSICYGLICSMLKVDIRDFQGPQQQVNQQFLIKLKQIVLPMLMNLLSSKESESKAGGLNILGSFCGLSYDFSQVKISKNLEFFRKNSQFISLSIWQLVFDLQDDWDITIKEASVVLIQLCAPRDAVKYFDKVKRERENIKFSNMLNRYGMGANGDQSSRLSSSRGGMDAQMQFLNSANSMNGDNEDLLSGIPNNKEKASNNVLSFLSGTADDMSLVFQMEQQQQQQNALSASAEMLDHITGPIKRNDRKVAASASDGLEESKRNNFVEFDDGGYQELIENDALTSHFVFFVDKYGDDQIQEIISIFRNDFKPPKNLWIEKNPSAAFNSPDYYAEIFSQAIDQFNQQQMQLQQKQHNDLQMQLSNSPKNQQAKQTVVDALEDDLVKRYENEKKEKEKQQQQQKPNQGGDNNFMIFERHFEDSQEAPQNNIQASTSVVSEAMNELIREEDIAVKKEELSVSSSNNNQFNNSEACSIDAEPFQFLDSPQNPQVKEAKKPRVLEEEKKSARTTKEAAKITVLSEQSERKSKEQQQIKKTTDELIEEYERKINNTKSLLEEEKKRVANNLPEEKDLLNNLTPEFKKPPLQEVNKQKLQVQEPQVMQTHHQLQSYLSDFNSNVSTGQDNAKLLKQIKNCFNDNNLVASISTTPQGAVSKTKQKLNKSYENLLAANKGKTPITDVITAKALLAKKNLSTSPRRGSSSGKKSGSSRVANGNKKKYLQQQLQVQDRAQASKMKSTMYNMRDLNFFIKNIEKDISEKFNKMNIKDFNSMPTTPTSILKKVEDQMRALAQSKDIKAQMSNTCPNIAQVLRSLESNTSKSVGKMHHHHPGTETHRPMMAQGQLLVSGHHGNNFQTLNSSSMMIRQSHNSLSNHPGSAMSYSSQVGGDKFQFSKTQKLDLKDSNKGIFNYNIPVRDGITHRELSNENRTQNSLSPFKDEKQQFANLLKQSKNLKKSGKRSRGSTDKYLILGGGIGIALPPQVITGQAVVNYASSSSSYSKLNKSANNIQGTTTLSALNAGMALNSTRKKGEQAPSSSNLSQQLINSFAKANNMSPNNKKLLQQMVQHQFIQPTSSNTSSHHHGAPQSAGLPQALSVQNNSITNDIMVGDLSKRGPSSSKPKEKTPKKMNTHRKPDGIPKPPHLETLELSPLGDDRLHVGLKNVLKSHK